MHADTQTRNYLLEMPTDEQVGFASDGFRMLADPTRIKILWALLQGESSVAHLAEVVGAAPTAVSQHLAKLRLAKLVRVRREGTFAYYSAVDDHVARLLTEALDHADHQVGGPARGSRSARAARSARSVSRQRRS
jgi:DNA-binding transcriptional ArsR family regulator